MLVLLQDLRFAIILQQVLTASQGKGPNKGKKVPHKNVVEEIINIGIWNGGDNVYALPITPAQMAPGMSAVAVVQGAQGGPIVAVAKIV